MNNNLNRLIRPGGESAAAMRDQAVLPAAAPRETASVPLARLRVLLERLARAGAGHAELASLPLGAREVDGILGGGLQRGALHEVAPLAEGDATAAGGFCAALLARALVLGGKKPVLWVRHERATFEDGAPYGPGLAALGLDPARILFVLAGNAREVLAAMEQALRSATLAAVFGELRGAAKLDLRASRRLSLAASRGATPALLLRLGAGERLSAPVSAATRWRIAALASGSAPADDLGAPRFQADLVRNRRGPAASFSLEWRTHDRTFLTVPALRERLVSPAFDRPHPAPAQKKRSAPA